MDGLVGMAPLVSLKDDIKGSLGIKEKLALWVVWRWLTRELDMGVLTGWRTKAGGLGLILTGVAAMLGVAAKALADVADGHYQQALADLASEHLQVGVASVTLGLGVLGIGGKIERAATGDLKREVEAAKAQ